MSVGRSGDSIIVLVVFLQPDKLAHSQILLTFSTFLKREKIGAKD